MTPQERTSLTVTRQALNHCPSRPCEQLGSTWTMEPGRRSLMEIAQGPGIQLPAQLHKDPLSRRPLLVLALPQDQQSGVPLGDRANLGRPPEARRDHLAPHEVAFRFLDKPKREGEAFHKLAPQGTVALRRRGNAASIVRYRR